MRRNWNIAGNRNDSLRMVHKVSTDSPTGHSPKSKLSDGEMSRRTGSAVAVSATSANFPRWEEGKTKCLSLSLKWMGKHIKYRLLGNNINKNSIIQYLT